jgi:hypothetical protein
VYYPSKANDDNGDVELTAVAAIVIVFNDVIQIIIYVASS